MNAHMLALLIAACLFAYASAFAGQGVDDEPAVMPYVLATPRPTTALDDGAVRPGNASRQPIRALDEETVSAEPRAPRPTRTADDEVVRPLDPVFRPERALDDSFTPPAARSGASGNQVAEDPAGRAAESSTPRRRAKSGP